MTKDDKVFGTIFLFSRLHKKKLLSLGKSYLLCEESADVSKFTKFVWAGGGLYYGNLDFNFNVDEEKTLLNLDQRYLNVHYLLKHVSRF